MLNAVDAEAFHHPSRCEYRSRWSESGWNIAFKKVSLLAAATK
jgi:hypothetical protein